MHKANKLRKLAVTLRDNKIIWFVNRQNITGEDQEKFKYDIEEFGEILETKQKQ